MKHIPNRLRCFLAVRTYKMISRLDKFELHGNGARNKGLFNTETQLSNEIVRCASIYPTQEICVLFSNEVFRRIPHIHPEIICFSKTFFYLICSKGARILFSGKPSFLISICFFFYVKNAIKIDPV